MVADGIDPTSFKAFNGIAIRCLQRRKYRNVTRLQLVRCVGGQTAQTDVISKAVL